MDILFYWVGGATFILSIGDLKIACDPVLCEKGTVQDYFWFTSERLEQPVYNGNTFNDIDIWLVTHNHADHLDSIGLSKINNPSSVVTNKNSASCLLRQGIRDLTILTWYKTRKYSIKGYEIEITAVPAIHGVNPLSALLAGKVNGYYITITKGKEKFSIYVTGDTVYKRKVIKALNGKKIDLMIPNMGAAKQGTWIMTLTLNAEMLKMMISKLDPKTIVPVHYGTFKHYREPIVKTRDLNDDRIKFIKVGESLKLAE